MYLHPSRNTAACAPWIRLTAALFLGILASPVVLAGEKSPQRVYENRLTRIVNPKPILADHPELRED